MDKTNNLKEFLIDLYNGIASKKPDASRNPQNFRAEIEGIVTGGEPWDETDPDNIIIEGEPIPDGNLIIEVATELTENRSYTASEFGADGISKFTVNVAASGDSRFAQFIEGTLTEVNDASITTIGSYGLVHREALTSINLPSVTYVNIYAFQYCTKLTNVNLPKATYVGNHAFSNCSALTNVNLPLVKNAGSYTFYSCTALTSIDLPSVTEIEANAFYSCTALATVILRSTTLCKLRQKNAFSSVPNGLKVYVPSALIESYQNATNWSSMYAGGQCTFVAIEGSEYE